jgi:hypothetical protein
MLLPGLQTLSFYPISAQRGGAWRGRQAAGGTQLDSSVGTGTYIPRTASRPCRITEGIERAQRA